MPNIQFDIRPLMDISLPAYYCRTFFILYICKFAPVHLAFTIQCLAVLGLCAVVSSCPYDIPPYLPGVLMVLGNHLHDPQPLPATIKRVLQDFKRTHQDNWMEHKVST